MVNCRNVILSPWVLSILPFLLIILLIHNDFRKYLLETGQATVLADKSYAWYDDLDGDGSSEMLFIKSSGNFTSLALNGVNGIIDQWNFRGGLCFQYVKCPGITGDSNGDGMKEVYIFTLSSGSILLHCINNIKDSYDPVINRLISVAGKSDNPPDPFIIPAEMEDLDGDLIKELIFGIGSGFSKSPRNVYSYNIVRDSLSVSPESYYYIWKILQTDITGDGTREIIPYGYATSNVGPEEAEYHDCSATLMVLDKNLRFLFRPLQMGGNYSKITPVSEIRGNRGALAFLFNPASSELNSTIYHGDSDGTVSDSLHLPFYANDIISTKSGRKNLILLSVPGKGIGLFNEQPEEKKFVDFKGDPEIVYDDFDSDGKREILLFCFNMGSIKIFREGLKHPVELAVPTGATADFLLSDKRHDSSGNMISIQSGRNHYLLKYGKNPLYPFRFLVYFLIYSGLFAFTFFVKKIQEAPTKRKFETEKKISELQMALIRNQLDPHFTLNVINSVIYSVEHYSTEQAGNHLRRFAGLYRNLLLSAGSVQRTISEELEFCRDYLELEQMRFNGKFEYNINVGDNVDASFLIPRMLVQIHVENAIKHGLAPLKSGGSLTVSMEKQAGALLITVEDNGIGREMSAGFQKKSTGKGLGIMNELYSVYGKYYNESISSEITDLFGSDGKAAGTRVLIKIAGKNDFLNVRPVTAMIVDDEDHCIKSLRDYLITDPGISVIAAVSDPVPATAEIIEKKPDLLFLDIQMPGKSGFEILGELRRAGVKPCVIFVTAFENFAIRAIKASAFDYILKPVDRSELAVAVERAIARINDTESERNFSLLLEMTSRKKLRFNTAGGFILIDPSDIIYVQADWNYSEIHLGKEKHEVVVVNIGEIEKMLPPQEFARISRSVIVNLKYLSKVQRIKRLCILNKDGEVFQFRIPLLRIRDLEKLL